MKTQRGVSLSGFIGLGVIICIAGLTAMKIVPTYINHYRVVHALKSLKSLPKQDLAQSPTLVARTLRIKAARQLYLNEIRNIKSKDIKVNFKHNKYIVSIQYKVKKPFFYNIKLLFNFKTKVEVSSEQ